MSEKLTQTYLMASETSPYLPKQLWGKKRLFKTSDKISKKCSRTCTKNQWKGLLVHSLNPNSFTLEPTTPQIFRWKKLSGMIWNVSKLNQNDQIYMFFVHFKAFYEQKWQKTCEFGHFDSILRRSISFPITFLIEIFEEWLDQGSSSLNLKCVPITPFIDFWYMSLGSPWIHIVLKRQ